MTQNCINSFLSFSFQDLMMPGRLTSLPVELSSLFATLLYLLVSSSVDFSGFYYKSPLSSWKSFQYMKRSKRGSKQEQSAPHVLQQSKTILRNKFRTIWQEHLNTGADEDSIHQPGRAAQVTIFRLRTGHCRLLSCLHTLKVSHTDYCL